MANSSFVRARAARLYALGLVAISAEILLLNLRAWQLRDPLRLNALERLVTRGELTGWSVPVGVGIVALIFALTLPTGAENKGRSKKEDAR